MYNQLAVVVIVRGIRSGWSFHGDRQSRRSHRRLMGKGEKRGEEDGCIPGMRPHNINAQVCRMRRALKKMSHVVCVQAAERT
jgi:hypothetical protein